MPVEVAYFSLAPNCFCSF